MLDLKRQDGIRLSSVVLSDARLVRLSWLVPLCSVLVAVTLHFVLGNARDLPFFISEADYPGPERFVFTTGLLISAVLHCLLTLRMYILFKSHSRRRILFAATILGVTSSTHLAVLAFANMYDYIVIHVYTSIVVFHGGFAWAILAHYSLEKPHPKGRQIRLASIAIAFVSLMVMTVSINRGITQVRSELGLESNLIPLNQLQPWIVVAAPAEFILFFSLLGCLASFSWDVRGNSSQFEKTAIEG